MSMAVRRRKFAKPGDTVAFPLKLFQYALGWTQKWMDLNTPADMAIATQAAERPPAHDHP